MSAAAVAVVATSGERHDGKAGVVLFAGLCDPRLSALSVPWCKKALYKYSSFPFLFTSTSVWPLKWRWYGDDVFIWCTGEPFHVLNSCTKCQCAQIGTCLVTGV